MNVIWNDLADIINDLLQPSMFGFIVSLVTTCWYLMKRIRKALNKNTEEQFQQFREAIKLNKETSTQLIAEMTKRTDTQLESLRKELKDNSLEVLRIQILEGIDTKRLSESEIHYFYDKYKALGGNSFVSAKVEQYLVELRKEEQ